MNKLFSFALSAAFAAILPFSSAFAQDITISSSDGEDSFVFGEIVESNIPLFGDLVAAGYSVRIDEPIAHDLSAAGFIVQVLADVGDDIRVAGNMIAVSGTVGDNLFAAGNEIVIRTGSDIGGDLRATGKVVEINAPIQGNAYISAEKITINARISGDVELRAAEIEFGNSGYIAGSLEYWSPDKNVSPANVEGDITHYESQIPPINTSSFEKKLHSMWSVGSLLSLLSVLAIGALLLYFFKNYLVAFSETSKKSPFVSMGIGFLALASLPVVVVLLTLSLVGFPLALLSLFGMGFLGIIAAIIDGFVIGAFLFSITKKTSYSHFFGIFTLGSIILFLLPILPLGLGYVIAFLIFLISLGSLLRCHWTLFLDLKKRKKI
jgi:hypothetical protein